MGGERPPSSPKGASARYAALLTLVAACLAGRLAAQQPPRLTLGYCLDAALEDNRELIQGRQAIRQVEGNRIVVRSRFHPHLGVTAEYNAERTGADPRLSDQVASRLTFQQRLFEFGPDFTEEVQMRESLRTAVYDYEGRVRQVLGDVWQTYHLILVQQRQLEMRRESLRSFEEEHQRKRGRYEKRLTTEEDVLSAELSVLSDSLNINSLELSQFSRKMELLRLIGQPLGTQVELESRELVFGTTPQQAVELALRNSLQVALADERLKEQQRVVAETGWEYSPDLSLEAGVEDVRRSASLSVRRQNSSAWGVDLLSEYAVQERPQVIAGERPRWFAQVEATIPVLAGGTRLGRESAERARLRNLTTGLQDLRSTVELQVRQAYQAVLEAEGRQRMQAKRAEIARRRLDINQILKDKGQADESLLETVRNQYFQEQDRLFQDQETYIRNIATLRRQMGYYE
ncbi:MAG: TolC family protein [Candidatus Latescibacterota bacterium]